MAEAPHILQRPQRWDASFDPEMSQAVVERLLTVAPFKDMDPNRFPSHVKLRDILEHDVRVRKYQEGEIIVRAGDYGTSAFMVLSGQVHVVLSPDLPPSVLGRRQSNRLNIFRAIAQLWSNSSESEFRGKQELSQDVRGGSGASATRANHHKGGSEATKVFLQDIPRLLTDHRTASLGEGEFFGELAALSRSPRTATVLSTLDETEMLEIRWQGLRDLMKYDESLRQHVDRIYRARALATHLRAIPIFRYLNDEQLQQVMDSTKFATYGDYEWAGDYKRLAKSGAGKHVAEETVIAAEGDYPNGVVLIRSGFARLSQKFGHGHRTLNYLGGGRHFGWEEIAHNWRHKGSPVMLQYSLRVLGYTHVLIVPTVVMEQIVLPTLPPGELPPLVEPRADEADAAPAARGVDASAKIGPDLLEFLTENRFFNGTATMAIDLDRCTRCDDCVRACAATHDNNPRFLRHGPTIGRIMVANACLHCADPVCMIGCPTGAIHRDAFQGEVVINQATCIGCQTCANNCPYEAIRMVEVRDDTGAFVVDQEMKPILKATKCDLCVEQLGGPACERACPHGALKRIDMNNLLPFADWLAR